MNKNFSRIIDESISHYLTRNIITEKKYKKDYKKEDDKDEDEGNEKDDEDEDDNPSRKLVYPNIPSPWDDEDNYYYHDYEWGDF